MTVTGRRRPLPPGVDRTAYRIIQEAVTNAARYGEGSVQLGIVYADAAFEISAVNSVPLGGGRPRHGGHGVIGMRERAALLGGKSRSRARTAGSNFARCCHSRVTAYDERSRPRVDRRRRPLMRAGLRGVLSSDDAIEVVGEAGDGRDAIYRSRHLSPDVVLMDVRMPDLDGIAATRELLSASRR